MVNDEFKQKAPEIKDIKIESGVIYFRNECKMRESCNAATSNIVLDFININTDAEIKCFTSKYGILNNLSDTDRKTLKMNAIEIPNYTPIYIVDEFRRIQAEIKSMLDIIPSLKNLIIADKYGSDFTQEEAEPLFYSYIEDLNKYIQARKNRICYNEKYEYYNEVIYLSLQHVIYCKTEEAITGVHIPKRCENCHEHWISTFKQNAKYCPVCRKTASKQKLRNNKKDDVREQTYLKVYNHFYTKFYRGYDQSDFLDECFDYETFKEQALRIKTNSSDFYSDLDRLCRKLCKCKKCQNGIATHYKNLLNKG